MSKGMAQLMARKYSLAVVLILTNFKINKVKTSNLFLLRNNLVIKQFEKEKMLESVPEKPSLLNVIG